MTNKIHTSPKRENAQTMVEFALVFPILLLIVFGLIEFGRMLYIYQSITSASREGARYGAAAGDAGGLTAHYMDCAGIRDEARKPAIFTTLPDSDIAIEYDHGPGTSVFAATCPPVDPDTGEDMIRLGDRIVVSVTGQYTPIVQFLGFSGFPINAQNARTILSDVEIVGTPPVLYTLTPTPTPTATPTETPTPTVTPTPTETTTPTLTPTTTETPTITPTPTNTPFGAPTWTPTNTPSPTVTPTSTPTYTPTPPCVIGGGAITFAPGGNNAAFSWTVSSQSTDPVLLYDLTVTWPNSYPQARLQTISAVPNPIWSGNHHPVRLQVCETCAETWSGLAGYRQINQGNFMTLLFNFSRAIPSGSGSIYTVDLTFRNLTSGGSCSISISQVYP